MSKGDQGTVVTTTRLRSWLGAIGVATGIFSFLLAIAGWAINMQISAKLEPINQKLTVISAKVDALAGERSASYRAAYDFPHMVDDHGH